MRRELTSVPHKRTARVDIFLRNCYMVCLWLDYTGGQKSVVLSLS